MDWHHAPLHRLTEAGAYIITAGTLHKARLFRTPKRLDMLERVFFETAARHDWLLQAWCLFSNHYHFVAYSETAKSSLSRFVNEFHSATARELNRIDGTPGRQVWFDFWDTHLTQQGSYLARLRYVHENAVHHRVVEHAPNYRWCSAGWFGRNATSAFYKAVCNTRIDRVNVIDDFS
jgi:putative transposase